MQRLRNFFADWSFPFLTALIIITILAWAVNNGRPAHSQTLACQPAQTQAALIEAARKDDDTYVVYEGSKKDQLLKLSNINAEVVTSVVAVNLKEDNAFLVVAYRADSCPENVSLMSKDRWEAVLKEAFGQDAGN